MPLPPPPFELYFRGPTIDPADAHLADSEFTDSQNDLIQMLHTYCPVASLIGSLFIIFTYLWFPNLRSFAFKLIFWMSVSDLLHCSSNFIPSDQGDVLCQAQAIIMTFAEIASVLWVGSIAYTIHVIYLKEQLFVENNITLSLYHIVIWGFSLLLSVLPLTTDSYGMAGNWCWITETDMRSQMWRFVSYYGPAWIIIFYMIWIYYRTWRMLRSREEQARMHGSQYDSKSSLRYRRLYSELEESPQAQLITTSRIVWYPTVIILTMVCATIDRVWECMPFASKRNFYMAVAHTITINLQGLGNALIYGSTDAVVSEWRSCCCCCFPERPPSESKLKKPPSPMSNSRYSSLGSFGRKTNSEVITTLPYKSEYNRRSDPSGIGARHSDPRYSFDPISVSTNDNMML